MVDLLIFENVRLQLTELEKAAEMEIHQQTLQLGLDIFDSTGIS